MTAILPEVQAPEVQPPQPAAAPPPAAPALQPAPKPARLVFIDALRGLAALAVAAYHIERYGPLAGPTSRSIAGPVETAIEHGWIGVPVFFVISGFVIAYSLKSAWVTPRYLGLYALRRSIRLDPPYWTTIAVALALHFVLPRLLDVPSPLDSPPSLKQVAWHLLYLQNVMGYDNLSVGLWTLCIEVQFYLLYAMLQGFAQRCGGPSGWAGGGGERALLASFAPLALVSLVVYRNAALFASPAWWWLAPVKSDACVLRYFWMFFLGMLVHWTLAGRTRPWLVPCYLLCLAARFAEPDNLRLDGSEWLSWDRPWPLEIAIAGSAGAAIYIIGARGALAAVGHSAWLQFLGRISYSLYLIHYPVSHAIVHLADDWGRRQTWSANAQLYDAYATLCSALALAASIGVAAAFYLAIEKPSLRLASRLRRFA